jgi:L-histidine N-alpha-methyltransferase
MSSLARIAIHSSQFPDAVRRDLLTSLRARAVNHKFLYDSVKQTQKWLKLHQTFSPWLTDPDVRTIYEKSYLAAAERALPGPVQVIGLGCGSGQKDTSLLRALRDAERSVTYLPCDVSTAMVLVARESALSQIADQDCFPVVFDLITAENPESFLARAVDGPARDATAKIITFFGMMPNFEPEVVLPRLSDITRRGDVLLLSANLAPGADYKAGVEKVLPLYDNELTRDWLMSFLLDLGAEKSDGQLRFRIEERQQPWRLRRIIAEFQFTRKRDLQVDSERFHFQPDDSIRIFFSYRHTPDLIHALLSEHGLDVVDQWITGSGEEGVFLAEKR